MNSSHLKGKQHTGLPATEPVPNWSKLSRADDVEIHGHGRAVTTGLIDMLALDGSVLWLQQNDGKGRVLFLHSDGVRVYRRPANSNNLSWPLLRSPGIRPTLIVRTNAPWE